VRKIIQTSSSMQIGFLWEIIQRSDSMQIGFFWSEINPEI
jgi:hypothetical protein